ncbi:hypothetical protein [Nitratifractor sp.]
MSTEPTPVRLRTFRLPECTLHRLYEAAALRGTSPDRLAREAIEAYLEALDEADRSETNPTRLSYDEFWDGVEI